MPSVRVDCGEILRGRAGILVSSSGGRVVSDVKVLRRCIGTDLGAALTDDHGNCDRG